MDVFEGGLMFTRNTNVVIFLNELARGAGNNQAIKNLTDNLACQLSKSQSVLTSLRRCRFKFKAQKASFDIRLYGKMAITQLGFCRRAY
jgi:hypothetical protein